LPTVSNPVTSRGLLDCDALQRCGGIPMLQRSMPWRWRQYGPLKRCYPTTALHGVTTQNSAWNITDVKVSKLTIRLV